MTAVPGEADCDPSDATVAMNKAPKATACRRLMPASIATLLPRGGRDSPGDEGIPALRNRVPLVAVRLLLKAVVVEAIAKRLKPRMDRAGLTLDNVLNVVRDLVARLPW